MKTQALILIAAFALTGCFESKFDREKAETILNNKLSNESILQISFSDQGFEKAVAEGIVKSFMLDCQFTDKGIKLFNSLTDNRTIEDFGMMGINPHFKSKYRIGEKVKSIDGIADAGNGRKLVEFTTVYVFPASTSSEIFNYIYTGRKAQAIFALYDDGWRIIQ